MKAVMWQYWICNFTKNGIPKGQQQFLQVEISREKWLLDHALTRETHSQTESSVTPQFIFSRMIPDGAVITSARQSKAGLIHIH